MTSKQDGIAIRNGRVLTPDGLIETDVLIADDRVSSLGGSFDAEHTVDAAGAWVGPGLVDLHVHFREPGQEWKEDIASGSRAAAAGGYTAVVTMPNTDPPIDAGHRARYITDRGRQIGLCEVMVAGAITMGRSGETLSHLDEMWDAGVRMFTDDGTCVDDSGLLRLAMEYLAERGGVIAQHPEDRGLARGGHMHEGPISSRLGIPGLPSIAEEVVVARDLALARLTGVRYHVQHVSSSGTIPLIRRARHEGVEVTAEVTPHHVFFDHERVITMEPRFKMYPPLRARADVVALREALIEGLIDAVATDHAPHSAFETEVTFEEAPRGVIGLETAAAAINTAAGMEAGPFFSRMSTRPALIGGFGRQGHLVSEAAPANLMVFDPAVSWTPSAFVSKAANSPFLGVELRGRVLATIFEGRMTYNARISPHRT